MEFSGQSKEERFIEEHATALTHNLAVYCAQGTKEITDILKDRLPEGISFDVLWAVLLSLRARIDLDGVRNKFGRKAHDILFAKMDELYSVEDTSGFARFSVLLDAAAETIRTSDDPREWPRIHCMKLLRTRDPEDEPFHMCLAYVFTIGDSIVKVVEANA